MTALYSMFRGNRVMILGHKKKDNSFRSQQNSKLTLRRGFLFCFFKSSESDDSLTIFSLDPTRLKTKH